MKKNIIAVCLVFAMTMVAWGAIHPAAVFSDHMVLQRDMDVPVWGYAAPGEKITVSFAGQTHETVTNEAMGWKVILAPLATNSEPQVLTIAGENETIEIKDVLVGEVWLCSGQSNMEMPLWTGSANWRNYDGDKYAAEGANTLIRFTQMKPYSWSKSPVIDYPMTWAAMDTENTKPFSAVSFFFSHKLQEELKMPIGLIGAYWGGTRIEPWTPSCGFDSVPELADLAKAVNSRIPGHPEYEKLAKETYEANAAWLKAFDEARKSHGELPLPPAVSGNLAPWTNQQSPTVLYNNMIHPFVPFAMRGAIWYQGCSNLGDGALYQYKMQALFNGWKQVFNNPEMKFYFVQLAPFHYGGGEEALPIIWEAQENFCKANEPQVGMVVINDVGDLKDIHPHNKKTVGDRLATMALNRTYGFSELKPDFPRPTGCRFEDGRCVISFQNVTSWITRDNAPVANIQVIGFDGKKASGVVEIQGTDWVITAPGITDIFTVRYMWNHVNEASAWNENNLPVGAFRFSKGLDKDGIVAHVKASQKLVYVADLKKGVPDNVNVPYLENHAAEISGEVSRVTYVIEAEKNDGKQEWMMIMMDAFTPEAAKCGIPTIAAKAKFQQKVTNMTVYTNVPDVRAGFIDEGNIEFWPNNYNGQKTMNLPAATDAYDFDDNIQSPEQGYGSMQIHSYKDKQTIFAFNRFQGGANSDFGFGKCNGANPDWTFSQNMKNYSSVKMSVYVLTKF